MEKLKLKSLGLGATDILSRAQMKNVWGGADCTVTNTSSSGTTVTNITWPGGSGASCSYMSSLAGSYASSQQGQCGGHTTYDCGCDGWGN